MKFVNLTKHTVTEVTSGQVIKTSGIIVRVKTVSDKVATHNKAPIYKTAFGAIEGLPAPVAGTMYIVSALALNAIPEDRTDVVAPGIIQRDENNKPIGCYGFRV